VPGNRLSVEFIPLQMEAIGKKIFEFAPQERPSVPDEDAFTAWNG
jgi:hypothetical protein